MNTLVSDRYNFNPEEYGFRLMPPSYNEYWGQGEKWYKVTCKSETGYWYKVCRKRNPGFRDDRWVIFSAVAMNDKTGRETLHHHQVFLGCITTKQFAELLLEHIMGTYESDGIEYGRLRLKAPFVEYRN